MDQLVPTSAKPFGDVLQIVAQGNTIYYSTLKEILVWQNGVFTILPWPSQTGMAWRLLQSSNRVFIHAQDEPLYEIRDGQLAPIVDSPLIRSTLVQDIVEPEPGEVLLLTRDKGIWRLQDREIVQFRTDADSVFTRWPIYSGVCLPGGLIAVAVQRRGLVFLDSRGELRDTFYPENGLPDPVFLYLGTDRSGGLWVCGDSSISRVEVPDSVTAFDSQTGLGKGRVYDVVRFGSSLYAATQNGLYRLDPSADPADPAKFERVGTVESGFLSLASHESGLLAAGYQGVFVLQNSILHQIYASLPAHVIQITRSTIHPNRFFLGLSDGIAAIRYDNGVWVDEGSLPAFREEVRSLVETKTGGLVLATLENGFFEVALGDQAASVFSGAEVKPLQPPSGFSLKTDIAQVFRWNDQIALQTGQGVLVYDDLADRYIRPAVSWSELNGKEIEMAGPGTVGNPHLWLLCHSDAQDAWPDVGNRLFWIGPDGWKPFPHAVSNFVGEVEYFYEEMSARCPVLWIFGTYGLVRVESPDSLNRSHEFNLFPREITANNGSALVFPGKGKPLKLRYSKREFRIRFATDRFGESDDVRFQTKVEGLDHAWSSFLSDPIWNSGALNEGNYTLRVRAEDHDGVESREFTLPIVIRAPWYRTPWAYGLYALAAAVVVFLLVRWRLWQMRLRERKLLSLVDLRTKELRESGAIA